MANAAGNAPKGFRNFRFADHSVASFPPHFHGRWQLMNNDLLRSELVRQLADCKAVLRGLGDRIPSLLNISAVLSNCLSHGGKLLLCGNGGSAADAEHVAAEFVGRFLRERRPLPAIALPSNSSLVTAIANDYDYSQVFARQVTALACSSDCVIGISTSGRSQNVLNAMSAARSVGATTIGFTGQAGKALAELCNECFMAPSTHTPRIQEAHLVAWHLICDVVEQRLSN